MKEKFKLSLNVGLFLLATLLLGGLQTSMWYEVFGYFPAPAFWIPGLLYVAMHRSTLETIVYSYLTAIVLSPFTVMPLGVLMTSCLIVAIIAQVVKRRIFWTSASYIMMVSGIAVLAFHFSEFLVSFILGDSVARPQVIDWVIEALLTPLVAPVLFPLFQFIDNWTDREQLIDVTSGQAP